jgi:hypothetical protein
VLLVGMNDSDILCMMSYLFISHFIFLNFVFFALFLTHVYWIYSEVYLLM